MPQMGVSVAEGTIVAWRVEVGDRIEADADDLRHLDRQDRHRGAGTGQRSRGGDPRPSRGDGRRRDGAGADRIGGATAPGGGSPGAVSAVGAHERDEQRVGGAGARTAGRYSPGRAADRRRARHRPLDRDRHRPRWTRAQAGRARRRRRRADAATPSAPSRRPEPPLHIESPYVPEPIAAGGGAR